MISYLKILMLMGKWILLQATIKGFYGLKTMGLGILHATRLHKAMMLAVPEKFLPLILMATMILISFLHRKVTTGLTGMKAQAEPPPPGLLI